MEFSTPKALHKIISANHKKILVDGLQTCPLQAMSVAFNFHKVDIEETPSCLKMKGLIPVTRNEKFLLK